MRRDTTTVLLPGSHAVHETHASTPGTRCPDGSAHHIVIDTPHGTSRVDGRCKKCGYSRDYAAGEEYGGFLDNDFTMGAGSPVRREWAS